MASGDVKVPIALQISCGFARVAIQEFLRVPKGTHVLALTRHSAATISAISSLATRHLQCQISILHMVSQYRKARLIQRKCRDAANYQYASTAALTFLSQNESMQGYQRKRLMQSFEQLPNGRPEKSHIPSKDKHTWDTDAIVRGSNVA